MIYPGRSKEFSLIDIRKDSHVESLIEMAKAFGITCLQQLFVKIEDSSVIAPE